MAAPCQHIHTAKTQATPAWVRLGTCTESRNSIKRNGSLRARPHCKAKPQPAWVRMGTCAGQDIQPNKMAAPCQQIHTAKTQATPAWVRLGTCTKSRNSIKRNGSLRARPHCKAKPQPAWVRMGTCAGHEMQSNWQHTASTFTSESALVLGQEIQLNKMAAPCQHIHTAKTQATPAWVRLGTCTKSRNSIKRNGSLRARPHCKAKPQPAWVRMGTCAGPRNSLKLAAPCQHIQKAPTCVGQIGHLRQVKKFNQTKWQRLASTSALEGKAWVRMGTCAGPRHSTKQNGSTLPAHSHC